MYYSLYKKNSKILKFSIKEKTKEIHAKHANKKFKYNLNKEYKIIYNLKDKWIIDEY